MHFTKLIILSFALSSPAMADDLTSYLWEKRPIVVFADTENDPRFIRQIELLQNDEGALLDRDVVIISDTQPLPISDLRKKLRPRGFMLVLIGKDGAVTLRKPRPWSVREIVRVIDKMPLRRDEIERAKTKN